MKKRYPIKILLFFAIVIFSTPAWSIPITDVGSIDTLIAETTLANSSDATELAWVQSILGSSVTFGVKYDTFGSEWLSVDGFSGVYAHLLDTDPEYFMIKTGNITTDGHRNFLYRNLSDFSYAVIDLGLLDFRSISNVSGISHLDEFNPAPVPEPGTMLLLGSGLVGLAGWGRKKFRK